MSDSVFLDDFDYDDRDDRDREKLSLRKHPRSKSPPKSEKPRKSLLFGSLDTPRRVDANYGFVDDGPGDCHFSHSYTDPTSVLFDSRPLPLPFRTQRCASSIHNLSETVWVRFSTPFNAVPNCKMIAIQTRVSECLRTRCFYLYICQSPLHPSFPQMNSC